MVFDLTVPSDPEPIAIQLSSDVPTIFVGANGSGKTRLAVHIENALGDQAQRISAHRALNLNPAVAKVSEKLALNGLRFGYAGEDATIHHRAHNRYANQKAATALLNDYDAMVQALFADQSRTALDTHNRTFRGETFQPVETKFQKLDGIWKVLLPTRELVIDGDDIKVKAAGAAHTYSASEMSDGERAIFYMIGQTLVASSNSVLIVDEPELHVHRSIMSRLWDQLESARPDCAFVFITHDLEFAAARSGQKFVIQSYAPTPSWQLSKVPADSGFSEELATLLLGSRHPVLFVEGDSSSLDTAIFRAVYPGWTIVPRGSCQDVIRAVASFRNNPDLSRVQCAGIVDGDDYDPVEVADLAAARVFALPVAEIENVFLLPQVLRAIAMLENLGDQDYQGRLAELTNDVVAAVRRNNVLDEAVMRYVRRRIDRSLKKVDLSDSSDVDELRALFSTRVQAIDVAAIASRYRAAVESALADHDLTRIIQLVDHKHFIANAASRFRNTGRNAFEAWLARTVLSKSGEPLAAALRSVLPQISA